MANTNMLLEIRCSSVNCENSKKMEYEMNLEPNVAKEIPEPGPQEVPPLKDPTPPPPPSEVPYTPESPPPAPPQEVPKPPEPPEPKPPSSIV